ncbi:hypothetical protein, partial [Permianibacter aggregans]
MLTEIEWWGGILIIWSLAMLRISVTSVGSEIWHYRNWPFLAYFVTSLLVLVFQFYAFEAHSLQVSYASVWVIASALVIFLIGWDIVEYLQEGSSAEKIDVGAENPEEGRDRFDFCVTGFIISSIGEHYEARKTCQHPYH